MAETSNLKLYVTPSSDVTTSLPTWVQNMAASDKDSNMLKIDDAYAALSSRIEEVAADPGMSFDELEYDTECYLHIKMNGEDVVEPVYIAGGSSEPATGAVMRLVAVGSRTVALAAGNDCTISFRFTSIDNVTSEETGDGVATYTHLIGATSTVLFQGDITQGEHSFTIPSSLLVEGKHTFTVQIEDAYGTVRTLKYTITVKAITISSTLTDDDIKEGDVRVDYTPTGSDVDKNIFFELDGKQVYTTTVATSGIRQSYTISAQSHGNHTLKIWATATIGGVEVTSNILTYGLVWKEEGNTTPIVSIKSFATPKQYTTVPVPYVVFDPANSIAEITLWEDGVAVNTLNVDSTLQEWNYTPQTSGTHVLKISCGNVFDSVTIEVTESGVTIGETTEGLVWKFDADGRSNSEANRDQWSYGDVSMVVPADFRWNRGGWGTDEDGYPCFTVPAGNRIQFTSKLFSTDWKSNGHYVKFIFKTANVCDYDAEVLSCYANGIGIQVTAQEAKLSTQQTSTTVPLFEDQYTELEFNVTSTSAYSEIITWAQGIPTSFILYGSSDGFIQADIAPITVGSDDCDVRLYCIREYDSSLTDEEIFANWIADSPSGEVMMDRFARNKIVDDNGDLDPNKIAELCPDLRVITLRCPKFTEGKKSKVYDCEVRHVMTAGGKQHCWTSKGVMHKGQGTSSDGYGNSGRNIDIDCSAGGFDFDDGTHADKYGMTSNSVPVNYFNIKVDVASSESANNACLTDEYQIFNPYLRAARKADPRVRDTMEFHPCVLFVQDESGELFGDTGVHYYAAGNMGNSKSNFEAQGLNASNPNECIVELANNTHDINRWRSDALTDEIWAAKEVLEFRFPEHEDATDTMKRSFERVLSWVVSTDTTQATNQALATAVTYGGVTYSIDTADYRKAKFINEFDDYFVSDSIMFFYLFTERHLMVDNRAKNTFWHTSDGVLWDLCMDYDNDFRDF